MHLATQMFCCSACLQITKKAPWVLILQVQIHFNKQVNGLPQQGQGQGPA